MDSRLNSIPLKMLTHHRHHLRLGHFVLRLHRDGVRPWGFLETLFQLALGLAGAKYQDRLGRMELRNDLVVVTRQVANVSLFAGSL